MTYRTKFFLLASALFFIISSYAQNAGASALDNGDVGGYIQGATYDNSSGMITVDSVEETNPSGPVEHNYPPPVATPSTPWPPRFISGYAYPGNLSMGTLANIYNDDSSGAMTTEVANKVTVGAGTSGLADGTDITLQLQFSLDGSAYTIADRTIGTTSKATAQTNTVFQIWDPAQEDIDFRPHLFDFFAGVTDTAESFIDGSMQHDYSWNWSAVKDEGYSSQNILLDSDTGGANSTLAPDQTSTCLGTPDNPACRSIFDTGLLTFTINTHIGAELNLWGWQQSISVVDGSGYGSTNFLNTMAASLTAADGVELTYALENSGTNTAPNTPGLSHLWLLLLQ